MLKLTCQSLSFDFSSIQCFYQVCSIPNTGFDNVDLFFRHELKPSVTHVQWPNSTGSPIPTIVMPVLCAEDKQPLQQQKRKKDVINVIQHLYGVLFRQLKLSGMLARKKYSSSISFGCFWHHGRWCVKINSLHYWWELLIRVEILENWASHLVWRTTTGGDVLLQICCGSPEGWR